MNGADEAPKKNIRCSGTAGWENPAVPEVETGLDLSDPVFKNFLFPPDSAKSESGTEIVDFSALVEERVDDLRRFHTLEHGHRRIVWIIASATILIIGTCWLAV